MSLDRRLGLLTPGQRDCLRLVFKHMTSKDIARELGVSPHTVDMRLRTAMRALEVDSRIDAARLLVSAEATNTPYQPLIYQSPDVAEVAVDATIGGPASTESDDNAIRNADPRIRPVVGPPASGPPRLAGASPSYSSGAAMQADWPTQWSGSLPWGQRNDLGVGARLTWIALIAIGSALGFGAILGALEALKRLL